MCNDSAQACFFFAVNKIKLQKMQNYYNEVPLEEFEYILANREYWNGYSGEWKMFSKMEEKLARLATFVKRGGNLNKVIELYAEGREYTYRVCIQDRIESYIETLVDNRIPNLMLHLYKLEREEAVHLLTELLKDSTLNDYKIKGMFDDCYSITKIDFKKVDCAGILARIEEMHKESHPNENIEDARKRVRRWMSDSWW